MIAYPTPPGVTVGAGVTAGATQINGQQSSLSHTLPFTAGNILYVVVSSIDVNGNLQPILPALVHPTIGDGTTLTAVASLPNAAQYTGTCATTGTVAFNVLLSSSQLTPIIQIWEYLP